jgi:hypothetical protein
MPWRSTTASPRASPPFCKLCGIDQAALVAGLFTASKRPVFLGLDDPARPKPGGEDCCAPMAVIE